MEAFDELAKKLVCAASVIQLSQIPFMLWMGKRMNFVRALSGLLPLGQAFVRLFAGGIVVCVSGLGLVILLNVHEVTTTKLGADLTRFLACFALFRFVGQLALGRRWPDNEPRAPHRLLVAVHGVICALYLTSSIVLGLDA
jgi:hypothetical protein